MTDPSAARYVEKAFLGALLADARAFAATRESGLEPDDFSVARYGDLYDVLCSLDREGWTNRRLEAQRDDPRPGGRGTQTHLAFIEAVMAAMRDRNPAYGHPGVLDRVELWEMQHLVPMSRHAPTYARYVLEGRIQREIVRHAARTVEVVSSGLSNPDDLGALLTEAAKTRRIVATLASRWGVPQEHVEAAHQRGATAKPPSATAEPSPNAAAREPAGRQATDQASARETDVIRGLLSHPRELTDLLSWPLRPDDFHLTSRRAIYEAIIDIQQRDDPIDPVTVMWRAYQRGALTDRVLPETIIRIGEERALPGTAITAGKHVLDAAIVDGIAECGTEISANAARADPAQALAEIAELLGRLTTEQQRWNRAHADLIHEPDPDHAIDSDTDVDVETSLME